MRHNICCRCYWSRWRCREYPTLVGNAQIALTAAYGDAAGQTAPSVTTLLDNPTDSFSATGYTLAPGIYKSPARIGVTGTLTLNGSATDVWIFQAVSSLTTAVLLRILS
ncbi:MAG: hypothetical protein COY98_00485 [Candidatus Yonathbacteria bacterium CG_4_10_14_0_8_um_filter_43_17]|uniref:Uncharacterized protein n=1 Tax=Candidatus Yonathbacteria bacterium CG_4_10_14_0_8_um_filter_43_17 TaxID=1975099 RepID=A0A2M7Q5Q2_9BACT|nr:MAG: hypothetical protein COY98_00485 [Candidatus Yonathbacteria bacterium CG_4_10_14_0_8_um_filter_43_17]